MATILPRILRWIEVIALIVSCTGIFFRAMHLAGAANLLLLGLFTLAIVYFLSAFTMVPVKNDGQPKELLDLLPTILRKVLFIAMAIYCVGFLFGILHLEGAAQQTMIGIFTLAIGTAISMALVILKRDRMLLLKAPLVRGIVALVFHLIWPLLGIA